MATRADEIKLDIDELNSFIHQAKRQKIKDVLGLEVRKLQTELTTLADVMTNDNNINVKSATTKIESKCYDVKLTNYSWDQSDKYMKLYIMLKNVQTLAPEAVKCEFSERAMELKVLGLENKNYYLPICNLCEEIDPVKSFYKVKTDMIVIFLAKKIDHKNWSNVTGIEKRIKEAKTTTPGVGDNTDPESSLMNLMKKMYQDGDDDMKRTIAKAWTQSQDKKIGGMPDIADL